MIEFKRLDISQKDVYEKILFSCPGRNCNSTFANIYLWGWQEVAFFNECVGFFSHFDGKNVYPYPIGSGDRRKVLETMIVDAKDRGIPCRIACMTKAESEELERWFPGKFLIRMDRKSFDYVYAIDDLADLKGRKFQKKRNHLNRFRFDHPKYICATLNAENMTLAQEMVENWFLQRNADNPYGEYILEQEAMSRAFRDFSALGMEGLMILDGEDVIAVTMASRLSPDTFDVHFEKARGDIDGAYAVINWEFARYLRKKHPEVKYLNREEDMGLEGLRKSKLSYQPHHFEEKYCACLMDDMHGYDCTEDTVDSVLQK